MHGQHATQIIILPKRLPTPSKKIQVLRGCLIYVYIGNPGLLVKLNSPLHKQCLSIAWKLREREIARVLSGIGIELDLIETRALLQGHSITGKKKKEDTLQLKSKEEGELRGEGGVNKKLKKSFACGLGRRKISVVRSGCTATIDLVDPDLYHINAIYRGGGVHAVELQRHDIDGCQSRTRGLCLFFVGLDHCSG